MGYYSTLFCEGKVKEYDREALKKLNEILKNEDEYETQFQKFGFEGATVKINDENGWIDIDLDEFTAKFYYDEEFAWELAKVVKKGYIKLTFVGEDGERWGYLIIPGDIIELTSIYVPETIAKEIRQQVKEYMKKEIDPDFTDEETIYLLEGAV